MKLMPLVISKIFRMFFGVIFTLIVCQSVLNAQISAPASNYSAMTEYTSHSQDDIFIFYSNSQSNVGELVATSPDGTLGWDFIWTKWDPNTGRFSIAQHTDLGLGESTISNLVDGRYQVTIEKDGVSESFIAWVFNRSKDIKPSLVFETKDCDGVVFVSALPVQVHRYPDIKPDVANTSNVLSVKMPVTFSFQRENVELTNLSLDDYTGLPKQFFDGGAFDGEAKYTMIVTDVCGFKYVSDTVESETYVVDPSFILTPENGEAPLAVEFEIENSNRGAVYEWYLYDDITRIGEATDVRDSLLGNITFGLTNSYVYEHPGEYGVKVIAISSGDMNCRYISDVKTISVEASLFRVPNVFTPNGDGINDEFKIELYSVKSYSVKILNRWGRLVYEFEESDVPPGLEKKRSSKGWDGKINGKLASPGTYFYVIEAEGREIEGKRYTEKGSLTLLHGK